MRLAHIALLAAALACSGCPIYQANTLPDSAPLAQPATISTADSYTHDPSGFVFPKHIDEFQRARVTQYDEEGLDVSVGYGRESPSCRVVATIYVYPTPRMQLVGASPEVVESIEADWLSGAYERAKEEIAALQPAASLRSDEALADAGHRGRRAVYDINDRESELVVFVVDHQWFVKYRHTYPATCATEAREQLRQLHGLLAGAI